MVSEICVQWIQPEDRNTIFYHLSTVNRQCPNRIVALQYPANELCDDQNILKGYAREYFVNLFSSPNNHSTVSPPAVGCLLQLSMDNIGLLTEKVEYWETTNAIKLLKPYKAPRPDGFQPIFFQKYWHVVGPLVHSTIVKAFEVGTFVAALNETLLILIPKADRPETIWHFRPISLCNVLRFLFCVCRNLYSSLLILCKQVSFPDAMLRIILLLLKRWYTVFGLRKLLREACW